MPDPDKIVIIANPAAGGGRVSRERDAITTLLRSALGDCELLFSQARGDAIALTQKAKAAGATVILSLGGDGTHNEVINGLLHQEDRTDVRMGVLSAGSGGDFCRLTVGGSDLEKGIAAIAAGLKKPRHETPRIDIGRMSYRSDAGTPKTARTPGPPGSRCFMNIGSVGISGLVCRMVNASSKPLGGTATYLTATVRSLIKYRPARVRVSVDGEVMLAAEITSLAICNGQYAGGGMQFGPRARLGDGSFDVVAIQPASLFASVRDIRRLYNGKILELPYVSWRRGRQVTIETLDENPAWVELDGETPGVAPAAAYLLPHAIPMLGLRPEHII